uniref:RRM domain-containing protein n=1 Tax=Oryza meridionalis TaxID=40149 RepID=A0A0E0E9H1_9ORYZ
MGQRVESQSQAQIIPHLHSHQNDTNTKTLTPSLAVVAPRRLLLPSPPPPPPAAARRRSQGGSSGVKREMGLREKKRNQRRVLARRSAAPRSGEGKDFLPLEERPGKKRVREEQPEEPENTSTVLYIGHIPHGFYEEQMQGFFQQFGTVKRLRIARNRKTGKSKHYGFIEFENPEVAKIVADEMNNYLLFEHTLQIAIVPPEKIHPKLYASAKRGFY